jgi:hypothetical protein
MIMKTHSTMKRSFHILASLVVINFSLTSINASAQSPLETLSKEAPNACVWALAALEQTVPPDIRQNLTYLREDLLDEGKSAPKSGAAAYKLGSTLCDQLIATLDERNQTAVRAGYRAAQADANTKVTSQSLEARRNYKMGWPQYARERDERTEIQRQQGNNVSLTKASVDVEWAKRVAVLRRGLDNTYKQYRDALREDASFQKPISQATNSPTIPNATKTIGPDPEFDGTSWGFHNKAGRLGELVLLGGGKIKSDQYPNSGWQRLDKDTIRFQYDRDDKSPDPGHVVFRLQDAARTQMKGIQSGLGTPRYLYKLTK